MSKDDHPVFTLRPEKVVFVVSADDELPAEHVRVHRHTRVYRSNGEEIGSAQRLVEAILRFDSVRDQFGREGTPDHKAFQVELAFGDRTLDEMMYLHKIEPSKLRPIESIRIQGRAEFDHSRFPVPHGRAAKLRVTWHTGKRERMNIRFGVRSATNDMCSQIWKVVTERGRGQSDIYLIPHSLKNAFKVSLHESGSWHFGFTEEYARSPAHSRVGSSDGRHWEIWDRPSEIAPGVTRAFQVVIPPAAARHPCTDNKKVVAWAAVSSPDEAIEFNVLITNPAYPVTGWPGKNKMGASLAGKFELENGEIVWVVYRNVPIPKFDNVRIAVAHIQNLELKNGETYSLALIGHHEDGSRFVFEAPMNTTSMRRAIESAAKTNDPTNG